MAKLNKTVRSPKPVNHENARAYAPTSDMVELRRAVASCFLWEETFYESGIDIADRISTLVKSIGEAGGSQQIVDLAVEARTSMNLRHVPLLLMSSLLEHGLGPTKDQINAVIQRPDEMAELISIFWRKGKKPLSKQMKLGIGMALNKFSVFSLSRYKGEKSTISLRDVIRLVHPTPQNEERSEIFRKIVARELEAPDTWETALSAGADKKETFTRLLKEGNLGYFALLRNLRNMEQAGVDSRLVNKALLDRKNGAEKILPFRFVAAARAAPKFLSALDVSMAESIKDLPSLPGKTIVLVDVSGSMDLRLSAKSDLLRMDAAAALAVIFPGEEVEIYSFSNKVVRVSDAVGINGIEKIKRSQTNGGTDLFNAIKSTKNLAYDRLVVITDEQYQGAPPKVDDSKKNYIINVGSYRNGVSYSDWIKIDGFSESVFRFMSEIESESRGA